MFCVFVVQLLGNKDYHILLRATTKLGKNAGGIPFFLDLAQLNNLLPILFRIYTSMYKYMTCM